MKQKFIVSIGVLTAALVLAGCSSIKENDSSIVPASQPEASSADTAVSESKQETTGELTLEDVLAAPETDASQFDWRTTDNGVYLRSCSSEDDIIVIPEEVDGQPVLGIDANGLNFLDCHAVVLPDSMKSLEYACIGVLENMEILVYGSGLEDGLAMPSGDMPALKIVYVREGAKHVPDCMVMNATELEKVYLPKSLEDFGDTYLIFNCGDPTFIVEPGSAAEQYAIDNGYKYENP